MHRRWQMGALLFAVLGCASQKESAPASAHPSPPAATTAPVDSSAPSRAPLDPAVTAWAAKVYEAVRANWSVPPGISVSAIRGRETAVKVKIGPDGTIEAVRLLRSSGDASFDDSCLQAVTASKSVPAPPPGVMERARRGSILAFDGKELPRDGGAGP